MPHFSRSDRRKAKKLEKVINSGLRSERLGSLTFDATYFHQDSPQQGTPMPKITIGMAIQHKLGIQERYNTLDQHIYVADILAGVSQGFSVKEMIDALDVEGSLCSITKEPLLHGEEVEKTIERYLNRFDFNSPITLENSPTTVDDMFLVGRANRHLLARVLCILTSGLYEQEFMQMSDMRQAEVLSEAKRSYLQQRGE